MKFLYWNLKNKSLVVEVAELIIESGSDICAFAEISDETQDEIAKYLIENYGIGCSVVLTPGCDRVKLIKIEEDYTISLLNQDRYYSILKLSKEKQNLIACFVHFPSKLHQSDDVLRQVSERLRNQVLSEEKLHFTENSLIMGDFNVNPFESPIVSFSGMAATNGMQCSMRKKVTRAGETTRLFYNPMWTLYSQYRDRPGSYRYVRTKNDVVTWHFLDQVLIRPTLIDYFNFDSLKLFKGTENFDYLNSNQVPSLSDHLPLFFEIDF